ncbi:MAG: hypothetical protein SFV52_11755 [Saprospiraceae bacterium]|nr:hypothetical protein [Saprospiraceae bacterium]
MFKSFETASFFLFLSLLTSALHAEELPMWSTLELAMQSTEIWEAEPVLLDTHHSWRVVWNRDAKAFLVRVTRVFRSATLSAGDTAWVSATGPYHWRIARLDSLGGLQYLQMQDTITRLLVYGQVFQEDDLNRGEWPETTRAHGMVWPLLSGIRLQDNRGGLWWPFQPENPGGYDFYRDHDPVRDRWAETIERTRFDIRRVDTLMALRNIWPPEDQNRALFAWINDHRAELGDSRHPNTWSYYTDLPFSWILCNGIDADAWAAVLLYDLFFPGQHVRCPEEPTSPETGEPYRPFDSESGRRFLAEKIADAGTDAYSRFLALQCLAGLQGGTREADLAGREAMFDAFRAFFPTLPQDRRTEYVIYQGAYLAFGYAKGTAPVPDAVEFFMDMYRQSPPGQARLYLARVVAGNASAAQWKSVSGNDAGLLFALYGFEADSAAGRVLFYLYQNNGSDLLYELPTVTCYQLDEAGAEQNRFTMPLPVLDRSLRWSDGIGRNRGALRVGLPVKGLAKGTWYVRVSGTAGKDRVKRWTSEVGVFGL